MDVETAARLSDVPWEDMRDIRNLLIHQYFGVSVAFIWETIASRFAAGTRGGPQLGATSRGRSTVKAQSSEYNDILGV